jgi:DNA-binding response OmpR family regulator
MDVEEVDVVLVEDEAAIAGELVSNLRRNGLRVRHVVTGREAVRAAPDADVVLLDLALPDLDGTEVCRRVRARSQVPIIVLSGRAQESDRVEALNLGADDYLVKPFSLRELIARIHAVRRRIASRYLLAAGGLRLDRRRRETVLRGSQLRLAAKEFDLLALLMEDPGMVYTRRDLLDHVWREEWYGRGRTLDVHIARLRAKLGDPSWIETVRGVGFRLTPPKEA